jgi:hypothetical protein
MGATEFAIDNVGKTIAEAYEKQVTSDRYNFGHAGYTGTLAEKDGFVLIDRPPRITAGRMMDTITDATQWLFWLDTDEKYRHAYAKPKARCRQAWQRLQQWQTQQVGWGDARRICEIYDDKWGPALAVEQSPAEKKERWKGLPRGTKTFLFFGMASC